MLSLEQRLDKVEGIIKKPSFRQNKGLGNEVGYYIFDYPAEQELTVREYVEYIRQKNEEAIDGFRIAVFDLYDILISILKDKGYCDVTRSVSKTTEIEGRGGKRWDKPKKAEKSRDCGDGKF